MQDVSAGQPQRCASPWSGLQEQGAPAKPAFGGHAPSCTLLVMGGASLGDSGPEESRWV